MKLDSTFPNAVISSVIDNAKRYLTNEVGIDVTRVSKAGGSIDLLQLKEFTAVVGIGGNIGLLVAFSFPRNLVDALYSRLTAGLKVPQGEEALYLRSTVTETANIIVGHCTADLTACGERISMSPPVLLEETKHIHRMKDAAFSSVSLVTPHGILDIHLVGPPDMFNAQLDYVNEVRQWNA